MVPIVKGQQLLPVQLLPSAFLFLTMRTTWTLAYRKDQRTLRHVTSVSFGFDFTTAAGTAVSESDAVSESGSVHEGATVLFWEENHPGQDQNSF